MVRTAAKVCDFGWKAADCDLPGVDGARHTPASARGPNGLLVMFICNHCPYVKAVIDRVVRDCRDLAQHGVGSIAVMSNDPTDYPEDSFDNMKRVAREKGFPFPYVLDETQAVAKAYGAVCTPDYFGFNAGLELQYRGRTQDLLEAMLAVARTGRGPSEQVPSIGCSIKWRS